MTEAIAERSTSWWDGVSEGSAAAARTDWQWDYWATLGSFRHAVSEGYLPQDIADQHLQGWWAGFLDARRTLSYRAASSVGLPYLDDPGLAEGPSDDVALGVGDYGGRLTLDERGES